MTKLSPCAPPCVHSLAQSRGNDLSGRQGQDVVAYCISSSLPFRGGARAGACCKASVSTGLCSSALAKQIAKAIVHLRPWCAPRSCANPHCITQVLRCCKNTAHAGACTGSHLASRDEAKGLRSRLSTVPA